MEGEHPLRALCANWLRKIKKASEYKKRVFGDDAQECMKFFNGPYDFLYGSNSDKLGLTFSPGRANLPQPIFRMSANKVAEMVQLFGPVLYQKNPHRSITPRLFGQVQPPPMVQQAMEIVQTMSTPPQPGAPPPMMPNPVVAQQAMMMVQQWQTLSMQAQQIDMRNTSRSQLLEQVLNYTPYELDLLFEIRGAIDEAIIKGMGTLWTEVTTMPTGQKMVGTFYDSVDNLMLDPDAERLDDCWWVARRCTHATWDVEREYGLEAGSLKGNSETWNSQEETDSHREFLRSQGGTNDLITYWKIYSKMGMGGRMKDSNPAYREVLETYGDYCLMVVADGIPYPLNVPPQVMSTANDEEIRKRVSWPVPFHADRAWPVTCISFHQVPRQVWPMSHLKPGLGYLTFLNWAYSFLASKMPTTCKDIIIAAKGASEEIKSALSERTDLPIVELTAGAGGGIDVSKLVQFLQHPPFNKDMVTVIEIMRDAFDRATGLTDLMYGESKRQYRSAAEAEAKQSNTSIRPDDMRSQLVAYLTEAAKKEAMAVQTALTPEDLAPVLGPLNMMIWGMVQQGVSPAEIVHQLSFRIEADDTRIPNREKQAADMQTAMQVLGPPLFEMASKGGPVEGANALITQYFKVLDFDPAGMMFPPPPPPQPPAPEPPKLTLALKGEDVMSLGLWPYIQTQCGVEVKKPDAQPDMLASSEAQDTQAEAAKKKAAQKPTTQKAAA